MSKSIFGAATMLMFLAACASAQAHDHGAQAPNASAPQAADSSQSMMQQHMQQMQQRMESMQQMKQEHMQDMQPGGMQGMQMDRSQAGGQGMQGMGAQQQTRARDQSCLASSQQAGLSALLMGSTANLSLTDDQRAELDRILGRARTDALAALTPEQRARLEAAPTAPATCPRATTQAMPSTN